MARTMLNAPPAPRIPRVIPRRLPQKKRMTIALGIISTGGLVLAADTEESIAGWMKTSQTKLDLAVSAGGIVVVSGAGTAGYIDSAAQRVHSAFQKMDPADNDYERLIERTLRRFHREHVIPFGACQPNERPELFLLIGVHRKGRNALFTTEKSAVRSCRDKDNYVAIGAGGFYARSLLGQYYAWELDLQTAEILAAYVLFRVKNSIGGCGGHTEMCRMHAEGVEFVNPRYIDALEQRFRDLERLERSSFYYVVGGHAYHSTWVSEQADVLREKFDDLQKVRDEWWLPPQGPLDASIR